MKIWMELHCEADDDVKDEVAPGEDPVALEPRCWSDAGKSEGVMTTQGITTGIKLLRVAAAESGWRRIPLVGWCCPHCAAVIRGRKVARGWSAGKLVE